MKTHPFIGAITIMVAGMTMATVNALPANAQSAASNARSNSQNRNRTIVRHHRNQRRAANVTLNLQNAPVRTALMQLFQKAGRDYSLDNDISGIVTLRVTRKPFAEALRLIAENASTPLAYNLDSGVYFIRPVRTQAIRSNNTAVAQNTAPTTANLPESPANIAAAETVRTPPVNYLGNFNPATVNAFTPFGVPGYPGVGLPLGGFGGASPVYSFPGFYQTGPPVFYSQPPVLVAPGTTIVTPSNGTTDTNGGPVVNP